MKPTARLLLSFLSLCLALSLPACRSSSATAKSKSPAHNLFTQHVKPILQENCLRCHNGQNTSLLDLSNRAAAFLPDPGGRAYIMPGKPDESLLIEAVSRNGLHQRMMPRLTVTLTDMDIGTLREWIEAGAPWPTGPAGNLRHSSTGEQP
jgi:hypothetical protein